MGTNKYLVRLTPHDKFFFGGERTFGQKSGENDKTSETNYFVKSNYFPQQTALLGFIRHQLLLKTEDTKIFKNNKIQDRDKAGKLIGDSSFIIGEKFPYGKIHSLSPVFISKKIEPKNYDFYFPANKEYQSYKKLDKDCKEDFVDIFLELENSEDVMLLKDYDPKYEFNDFLINKKLDRLKYDKEVFIEHKQVGIRKKYEGGTDNEAYYIQIFYKLVQDFSLAFVVELDSSVVFKGEDLVVFGGEQQSFKMEVEDFRRDFAHLVPDYKPSKNYDKVVLVSDAYVENNDVLNEAVFAVTDTVDFRFLSTQTDSDFNYYNKPQKSNKYNLFKRGSVFYGDIHKIHKCFDNQNFNKLGYNFYKSINKQTV